MPPAKPQPASLDLDALDAEQGGEKPFSITVGGRQYELVNIRDLDYREVIAASRARAEGNHDSLLKIVIGAEDAEAFMANRLTGRMLEAIWSDYNKHYGLPSTLGEVSASSPS